MVCDQEPRDHEGDSKTDVAVGDGRQAGVVGDRGENGDGAQPFDIRSKIAASAATTAPVWCRDGPLVAAADARSNPSAMTAASELQR